MAGPTPESLNAQLDEVKMSVELLIEELRKTAHGNIAEPLEELVTTLRPVQTQLVNIKKAIDGGLKNDAVVKQQLTNALDTAGEFIHQMIEIGQATRQKMRDAHINLDGEDPDESGSLGPRYEGFLGEDEQYQDTQNMGPLMDHVKYDVTSLSRDFKFFKGRLENEWGIRRSDGQGAGM